MWPNLMIFIFITLTTITIKTIQSSTAPNSLQTFAFSALPLCRDGNLRIHSNRCGDPVLGLNLERLALVVRQEIWVGIRGML